MPRYPLHPASGTGINTPWRKCIRFARYGCANRPFYHIVVMNTTDHQRLPPIEQLGTFDPIPNQHNEKLVTLNYERITYWMAQPRVSVGKPVAKILGLSGFLPIYPLTYYRAWRNRKKADEAAKAKAEAEEAAKAKAEAEEAAPEQSEQSN